MEALPEALQGEKSAEFIAELSTLHSVWAGCMSSQLMQGCPGNRNVENTFVAHAARSRRCFASGLVLRKTPMDASSET